MEHFAAETKSKNLTQEMDYRPISSEYSTFSFFLQILTIITGRSG
jgi:hypothetical protein